MRILLDENLPHDLRHFAPGHAAVTVAHLGWSGIGNGERLRQAAAEGFDVVVAMDAGMQYEQNRAEPPLSVVILRAGSNAPDDLSSVVPELLRVPEPPAPRTLVPMG